MAEVEQDAVKWVLTRNLEASGSRSPSDPLGNAVVGEGPSRLNYLMDENRRRVRDGTPTRTRTHRGVDQTFLELPSVRQDDLRPAPTYISYENEAVTSSLSWITDLVSYVGNWNWELESYLLKTLIPFLRGKLFITAPLLFHKVLLTWLQILNEILHSFYSTQLSLYIRTFKCIHYFRFIYKYQLRLLHVCSQTKLYKRVEITSNLVKALFYNPFSFHFTTIKFCLFLIFLNSGCCTWFLWFSQKDRLPITNFNITTFTSLLTRVLFHL